MAEQIPTIGRIVQYVLTTQDAEAINRRRTSGPKIQERMLSVPPAWPAGAQAHIGNQLNAGEIFPMVICKTWGDQANSVVNGQVLLDGNDVLWVTSVSVGDGPGHFAWPKRG
jgi:hypothetical protein